MPDHFTCQWWALVLIGLIIFFRARRAAKEAKDAPAQPQPVRSILFPHTNGSNNTWDWFDSCILIFESICSHLGSFTAGVGRKLEIICMFGHKGKIEHFRGDKNSLSAYILCLCCNGVLHFYKQAILQWLTIISNFLKQFYFVSSFNWIWLKNFTFRFCAETGLLIAIGHCLAKSYLLSNQSLCESCRTCD
jgi:hypothetical protein